VLYTAFQRINTGDLSPTAVLTLRPELVQANPYADLPAGARMTVACALQTMIEMSGNAAADLLEERLSTPAINAQLHALGMGQSELTPDGATTSPADIARLLELIGQGDAVSPDASAAMLRLLARQQHADLLPAPLPLGIRVAHKTGQLPGLRHDAGIVYAPSGPYLFVALVEDAPSEAAARSAIIELSRAAYTALEPGGIALHHGLPPRLAREVFRVPDEQGRLALLRDPRTETVPLGPAGVALTSDAEAPRLRPEAVPDLLALQGAAAAAGVPFWVSAGFQVPTDADAAQALPLAWHLPCAVDLPTPPATRGPPPEARTAPPPGPTARQHWLGTVVAVREAPSGARSTPPDTDTGRWLRAHVWDYGFIPALPETPAGEALGHEPWAFRWVGREMAAHLRSLATAGSYHAQAAAVLRRAQNDLAALAVSGMSFGSGAGQGHYGSDARVGNSSGSACWTDPAQSTQGCPSRWYFLPLS
ncbi:MAG: serine hydrolase, partial [Chloroflexota bacterium]